MVREGATIFLNDMRYSIVFEFLCICSRTMWIILKIARMKVCAVEVNGLPKGMKKKGKDFRITIDRECEDRSKFKSWGWCEEGYNWCAWSPMFLY